MAVLVIQEQIYLNPCGKYPFIKRHTVRRLMIIKNMLIGERTPSVFSLTRNYFTTVKCYRDN